MPRKSHLVPVANGLGPAIRDDGSGPGTNGSVPERRATEKMLAMITLDAAGEATAVGGVDPLTGCFVAEAAKEIRRTKSLLGGR